MPTSCIVSGLLHPSIEHNIIGILLKQDGCALRADKDPSDDVEMMRCGPFVRHEVGRWKFGFPVSFFCYYFFFFTTSSRIRNGMNLGMNNNSITNNLHQ